MRAGGSGGAQRFSSVDVVRELSPGMWHWEAPHPEWRPTEPWSENVSSYAIDDGERLLLFDPLAPPERASRACGRPRDGDRRADGAVAS